MDTVCKKCGCRAGFLYLRDGLCKDCRLEEQNATEKVDSLSQENKHLSQKINELKMTITELRKKGGGNENFEIERLNEIIIDLRQKGKQAVASRDKWKERAELAEQKQNEQSQNNDYKFKQVKKMFSRMYHPDSLTGDKFEKLIKQEIFKEFWQIIEEIEK